MKIIVNSKAEKKAFIRLSKKIHDIGLQLHRDNPAYKQIDFLKIKPDTLEDILLNNLMHMYQSDAHFLIEVQKK